MKKIVLLFTGMLMSLTTVTASEIKTDNPKGKHLDITKRYRYAQPIMFVERGIEFMVFPDGSFDFNTNYEGSFNNAPNYRKRAKRRSVNRTYGAPRHQALQRGVHIAHDNYGNIRRIGNVYLNYDRYGKIKRVGSVYMGYNRGNQKLTQVGGLRVNYNHWGKIVRTHGQVKPYRSACNICGATSCNVNHAHGDTHHDNDWNDDVYNNDDDFYYYKQNGKTKKQKKRKH